MIDFRAVDDGRQFDCDICLVGAGIAGLTLARELINANLRVLIVESGGASGEDGADVLNKTEDIGIPYRSPQSGRTRGFGGTTELWGGQCSELDAIDFLRREWVPDSGWPFRYEDLAPYYRRALELLSLPAGCLEERTTRSFPIAATGFDPSKLSAKFSAFSPKRYLGRELKSRIQGAKNIEVLTHATATELAVASSGKAIEGLVVRSLSGRSGHVSARSLVLCCGPIEVPRLLLASRSVHPAGVGNQYDLVGRFLQDHVICSPAEVVPTGKRLARETDLVRRGRCRWSQKLRLSDSYQSAKRVLNSTASVVFDYENEEILEPLARVYRAAKARRWSQVQGQDIASLLRNPLDVIGNGARQFGYSIPVILRPKRIRLSCISEQAPNPDSRVLLSEALDHLGVPRPQTDWRLTELERRTLETLVEACRQDFERLGLGRIVPSKWLAENGWTSHVTSILHPAGTTRMGSTATEGVVDANCRVFGVSNLYVAGASVFPTSGHANPGMTLIALAMRLADHLKRLD